MSQYATTLLFWISNAECTGDSDDEAYCYECARAWAAYIIAGYYYP